MKKSSVKSLVLDVVLLIVIFSIFTACSPDGAHTTDIGDYNSEQYPIIAANFPNAIPSNAEVVDFVYYEDSQKNEVCHLELKFYTKQELQEYLDNLLLEAAQKLEDLEFPQGPNWFYFEANPYSSSYTDIFCTPYIFDIAGKEYMGYEIDLHDGTTYYSAHYGIISYSLDELTIVHTYGRGLFSSAVDKVFPKYIERFSVPTDRNHKRMICLDELYQ